MQGIRTGCGFGFLWRRYLVVVDENFLFPQFFTKNLQKKKSSKRQRHRSSRLQEGNTWNKKLQLNTIAIQYKRKRSIHWSGPPTIIWLFSHSNCFVHWSVRWLVSLKWKTRISLLIISLILFCVTSCFQLYEQKLSFNENFKNNLKKTIELETLLRVKFWSKNTSTSQILK